MTKLLVSLFHRLNAVRFGEFKLSSGRTSDFYVNAKAVISNSLGLLKASECLGHTVVEFAPAVLGGMAEGVNNLLGGVLYDLAAGAWNGLHSVLIRKTEKLYGTGSQFITDLELPCRNLTTVVIEDVTTTGGSALEAVRLLRAQGLNVVAVVSLVDREEGAAEAFARENLQFRAVLRRRDLTQEK